MHNNNRPEETLKGNFTVSQGGLFWSSPHRSDETRNSQLGGWTSEEAAKGTHS